MNVVFHINLVLLIWSTGQIQGSTAQCLQGPSLDISTAALPTSETLGFIPPGQHLQSVIAPSLQFNCHGYITSWSALTVIDDNPAFIEHLSFKITFTLWRPREEGPREGFDLVGLNELLFEESELRRGISPIDNSSGLAPDGYTFFRFQNKRPLENVNITFQPGDIVGWNVEKAIGRASTITAPVLIVFGKGTSPDQEALDFHYLSVENGTSTYCSIEHCDDLSVESSVVPYVSAQYVETSGDPSSTNNVGMCMRLEGRECPETTVPVTSAFTTQCAGVDCSESSSGLRGPLLYYIIAGVAGIVILLTLMCSVAICICVVKVRRHLKKDNLEDNPTYESADKVLDGPSTPHSTFPMVETGIYATADVVRRQESNPETVECYASAYPSNGEAHLYQELPEGGRHTMISAVGGGHGRAWSVSGSREAIGPRKQIPIRPVMSSTPRLDGGGQRSEPPPPYSEVVKVPKGMGTPYLESRPSVTSLTCFAARPRAFTTSEGGPSLQNIPDELSSPFRTTTDGGFATHKIFHANDEEFFRVPTSDERLEFEGMESSNQIYSRLKFPHSKVSRGSVELESGAPYWQPSSSPSELYDQLARRNYREIHRDYIKTTEYIGGGHFGKVHRGVQRVPGGEIPVAIKTLNPDSSSDNESKFLKEAAIMGQFLHPNVVKLLGVVTVGQPLMIVLELMPNGDLSHYLRKLRFQISPTLEGLPRLLQFCRQIGFGMNYLANKGFVHRDLAARNVLLAEDLTCKIGDFGMARDLEEDAVYISQGGKMPLKWTAPESVKYQKFSSASDVWSYGMVLFEIWSLGMNPFEGVPVKKVMELNYTGYCQPPPPGCPRAIYQLMVDCWHTDPEKRIDFPKICTYLNSSPDEALLYWNASDLNLFPQATKLGAPLAEAKKLYLDLQYIHSTSQV